MELTPKPSTERIVIMGGRNRLSGGLRFQLGNWLKDNQERIAKNAMDAADVAKEAQESLGFEVTAPNITSLMGKSNGCWIEHNWPRGGGVRGPSSTDLQVVAQVLDAILEQTGTELSPELASNWETFKSRFLEELPVGSGSNADEEEDDDAGE